MNAIVSASGLKRCGWARVLNKKKKRTPNMEIAAGRGNAFHGAVETWHKTGVVPRVDDPEIQGWIDLLASQWRPTETMHIELAVGLGRNHRYVPVVEVHPHVYLPESMGVTPAMWDDASPFQQAQWQKDATEILLTAGRADVMDVVGNGRGVDGLDWKTGIWPPESIMTNLQQWALGLAAADKFGVQWIRTGLYFPRDGAFEHSDWVRVGSPEYDERLADVEQAATVGEEPKPGPNCDGCWEAKSCRYVVR